MNRFVLSRPRLIVESGQLAMEYDRRLSGTNAFNAPRWTLRQEYDQQDYLRLFDAWEKRSTIELVFARFKGEAFIEDLRQVFARSYITLDVTWRGVGPLVAL